MTPVRIAGAPISWGVCEVPDWGYQMPAERVLTEMQSLGLSATEFGPDGFLPEDPQEKAEFLASYGMHAVGGFLPILLHDPAHDPMPEVDAYIDACLAARAGVVVLAASTGVEGYDARPVLDELQWKTLLTNLDRIAAHALERGVVAAIHPHIGTVVEDAGEVQRVLDGSRIGLCIDTGHLAAAGADPVAITLANLSRVKHVHLKDVDAAAAARVVSGEVAFADAVAAGMWRVLGQGDVDISAMIAALRTHGYDGWYVLEQDVMFKNGAPEGEGPVADVRSCLDFVRAALA
ncbi:TIM barrel protein [Aeromicrobium sp. SMF47]|uniref:TIM barrel protein n=1 Tax=Aeromicrobium yanjiei TaxID=2662028 RepID=A0A5Q2MN04_9ACTN|nr:TIM barrel protein [Aeromicrobium yanjiei]MRK03240.1 TIM barrel protein [Aeromicrobium sp. S22]QGG43173.1 TIM barrel protein [Aeromicrobium yanjiei]